MNWHCLWFPFADDGGNEDYCDAADDDDDGVIMVMVMRMMIMMKIMIQKDTNLRMQKSQIIK